MRLHSFRSPTGVAEPSAEEHDRRVSAVEEMRRLAGGYRVTQAIHVAAVLGISDLLVDGPRDVEDLAASSGADADSLGRLLSALAAVGVYAEGTDGQFGLTELGAELSVPTHQRR